MGANSAFSNANKTDCNGNTDAWDWQNTLDVVVEGAVAIPVLVKDTKGVAVGEILKLDQAVHPIPAEEMHRQPSIKITI